MTFAYITQWVLTPIETDGFIIQRVCNSTTGVATCSNRAPRQKVLPSLMPRSDNCPSSCYYEIWRVENGSTRVGNVFAKRPQNPGSEKAMDDYYMSLDYFAHQGFRSCTKGMFNKQGKAIFVTIKQWKSLLPMITKRFKPGEAAGTGMLFSTCSDAMSDMWWMNISSLPGVSATSKVVSATWDCCASARKGVECCESPSHTKSINFVIT